MKSFEGQSTPEDIQRVQEEASRIDRRAFGKQRHIEIPNLISDIEGLASNSEEVDIEKIEEYTGHPGDLVHRVGFYKLDETSGEYEEFRQWYDVLSGEKEEVVYRTSSETPPEVAFSVYVKDFSRRPNPGIMGGSARYNLRGLRTSSGDTYEFKGEGVYGFTVVFSEEMKEKISSKELSDDELFKLYDTLKNLPETTLSSNEKMQLYWDKIIQNPYETPEHWGNLPTSSVIAFATFYRLLKKNIVDRAKDALETAFNLSSHGWDFSPYGVRLVEIKKDPILRVQPCAIQKSDIKAIIHPIPIPRKEEDRYQKYNYLLSKFR